MKKLVFAIGIAFVLLILTGCNGCSLKSASDTSYLDSSDYDEYTEEEDATDDDSSIKIAYNDMSGNIITIPVKINGMGFDMIFNMSASSTCITLAEVRYLYEKG